MRDPKDRPRSRWSRLALVAATFLVALAAASVFLLAEDDPEASADTELPSGCTWDLPYLICTYTSSANMSFDAMVNDVEGHFGKQVPSSTPVWVQAWSGRGGNGATPAASASGGDSGTQGYAMTIPSAGTLQGKTLYLYVGDGGSHGEGSTSGQGGASTIVSTQALSQMTGFPGGLIAVAGGAGGGGIGCGDALGGRGGSGGVAISGSSLSEAPGGNGAGYSGNQGKGGNADGHGSAGATGGGSGTNGTSGLGGYGGEYSGSSSTVGWVNLGSVDSGASGWGAGKGGKGSGGGGGGYGGGGGGEACTHSGFHSSGGGGGGGSYAIARAVSDSNAPSGSQASSASKTVKLTFDLTNW